MKFDYIRLDKRNGNIVDLQKQMNEWLKLNPNASIISHTLTITEDTYYLTFLYNELPAKLY